MTIRPLVMTSVIVFPLDSTLNKSLSTGQGVELVVIVISLCIIPADIYMVPCQSPNGSFIVLLDMR